jgi:carbonic anhydrase
LAHPKARKSDHDFILGQIKFFLGHFPSLQTVIIVGHQDCGYYKTIENHDDPVDKERKDLPKAVKTLSRELPGITVKAFYASFTDETMTAVIFEEVQAEPEV